jgi:chemotaxis protein CheX
MAVESSQEINDLVGDIWGSVLGIPAAPTSLDARVEEPRLTGFVHIHGDWEGTVTVDCPMGLATQAAAAMFAMEIDDLSKDEIDDALGEITNMTGGGIKSMLPGSCKLSLPTVVQGKGFTVRVRGTEEVHELCYSAAGSWMVVRVLARVDVEADALAAELLEESTR